MTSYPAVQEFRRYVHPFWHIPECHGRTDGQRDGADISTARKSLREQNHMWQRVPGRRCRIDCKDGYKGMPPSVRAVPPVAVAPDETGCKVARLHNTCI